MTPPGEPPSEDPLQAGAHIEHEICYMRPLGFEPPPTLAGLGLAGSECRPHTDHYFDAPGAPLHARKATLRFRIRPDERLVALKLPTEEPGRARYEREAPWACPFCQPGQDCPMCRGEDDFAILIELLDAEPLRLVRQALGEGVQLRRMFAIQNERREHCYEGPAGRLVLSEDDLTYSDGAREARLEVEVAEGLPALLDEAEAELEAAYPGIQKATEGKERCGRRHHASLLGLGELPS